MKVNPKAFWMVMVVMAACQPVKEVKIGGSIERLDPALDLIISPGAQVEIIAHGFDWSEGPVWVAAQKMLLFSDVPKNTIYKWTEEKGTEVYLTPSGYTGALPRGGEPGSNGLLIDKNGTLILSQHGDRRVASMDAPLANPKPVFKTLADHYRGKRFDSPNDVTIDRKGNLYFTDPPYGLENHEKDSTKDAPYQGVYMITPAGKVILLIDTLSAPNGIALSPDDHFLFIGNSDGNKARWYRYELGDTTIISGRVFYDISSQNGAPDGMKIDKNGIVFGSGPGGILIFSPQGNLLGKIKLPQPTANCAFSEDEKTLYITSDSVVLRVKMR